MNRQWPPAGHDRQRELFSGPPREPGKTLHQQVEGDHAYRDEPPEHAPPRPVTTYTIRESTGNTYQTTDADVAETYSRAGLRVTAETEGRI